MKSQFITVEQKIVRALRKAKADGMREAAEIINDYKESLDIRRLIRKAAARIERNEDITQENKP